MAKPKILMCSEASHTYSGYGTYAKEVLHRLARTNKYELAEFASYGKLNEPLARHVNWKFYPNAVDSKDPRWKEYKSRQTNQFGEWRFERVLLDFKPDIVFDIRDPYMFSYQQSSPLREFFHWAVMPTVDSAPQKTEWVDTFRKADGVLTYSEWGQEVLREHGNGTINLHGCASPGVDLEVFKPVADKQAHKERMGFLPDTNIIGTVMRNQKRKLLPDLFESFRLFLDNAKKDVADKTYLYLHTSYPDRGWDIPYLLNKFDLGNKVLFTYICTETKKPFYTFFQDGRTYSPYSGQATGTLPNVKAGLTQEQLAEVYNLFDVYVQYAICEGFGMPQVEAAACGVPVMAVDYSAMRSVVRNLGGTPLKVGRMFNEMETGAMRAYPDNAFLSRTLDRCFSSSRKERQANEIKARKKAVKRYGWDGTAKAWEDYFDSVVLKGHQGKWDEVGYRHLSPATQEPTDLTNKEFIDWIYNHVIIAPDDKFTLEAAQVLRDLNLGVVYNKGNFMTINRERIYETFKTVALNKTKVEQVRCGRQELAMPDFVRFADNKGQSV